MADPSFTLQRTEPASSEPNGAVRWVLHGHLTLDCGATLWRELQQALAPGAALELDLAGVDYLDGGAAALLTAALAAHQTRGGRVQLVGAGPETNRLLQLYDCGRGAPSGRPAPASRSLLGDVGDAAHGAVQTTRAILAFLGDLVHGLLAAVRRPRTVHLGEFGQLVERAGADGMPIVLLINFLIGAILGLQGAIQLHRFGGDQFLANLVGLSIVRELGPLMTAILVTGRSGASYAAELGTMTVNEEVDALRTLGQDPQRFLVFPRVLALIVVVPVLTVVGNLVGSVGGLVIAMGYLDQPAVVYLQSLERAVGLGDVGTGLLKSVFFAIAIGLIACQRGLSTRGGAEGVGRATTSAVVVVLFTLVALDAVFTWVFSLLEW
ncbi:MAG: MlaE family lipid ABC transporter permease subunit [Planctomycetes bacterium]|jgi:phospholipid/cholesterol/gamma-HCH transport system permease protein|nr:MlaE family lipid ABC transporter permease subunit [Planctomycetota bacterium]